MTKFKYFGLSGISIPFEQFDLSNGVVLRKTYAELFSAWLVGFSPASIGKPTPTPWRAATGGNSIQITVEMEYSIQAHETNSAISERLELLLALIRLFYAPTLRATIKLNMPIAEAKRFENPIIETYETEDVIFGTPNDSKHLQLEDLTWFRDNWVETVRLVLDSSTLRTALEVCDECRIHRRSSYSMLAVWGALEQLFAPNKTELRHRVAANIATYLEERGQKRLDKYKEVLKLYDHRSSAAHSTTDTAPGHFVESWMLLRNSLLKIIVEKKVPRQSDFEVALFSQI